MISVQASGCAPIVRAFEQRKPESEPWKDAATIAAGLRVPKALGDFLVLDAIYRSGGAAVATEDDEILAGVRTLARLEGIFACPEGGAVIAALPKLLERGVLKGEDTMILFNTGTAMKYLDVLTQAFDVASKD